MAQKSVHDGYAVWRKGMDVKELDPETKFLHMVPAPTLERIRQAIDHLPQLKAIRVCPTHEHFVMKSHQELMRGRGIRLKVGRHAKQGYKRLASRSGSEYQQKRKFLLNLSVEAQARWQLMRQFDLPEVGLVERYFCLEDQPEITLLEMAAELEDKYNRINVMINGTLVYLGYPVKSEQVKCHAREIPRKLERLQKQQEATELRKRFETNAPLPEGLPLNLWPRFARFMELKHQFSERYAQLSDREQQILESRYPANGNTSLTLDAIGRQLGMTRERVRQLEERALQKLEGCEFSNERKPLEYSRRDLFGYLLTVSRDDSNSSRTISGVTGKIRTWFGASYTGARAVVRGLETEGVLIHLGGGGGAGQRTIHQINVQGPLVASKKTKVRSVVDYSRSELLNLLLLSASSDDAKGSRVVSGVPGKIQSYLGINRAGASAIVLGLEREGALTHLGGGGIQGKRHVHRLNVAGPLPISAIKKVTHAKRKGRWPSKKEIRRQIHEIEQEIGVIGKKRKNLRSQLASLRKLLEGYDQLNPLFGEQNHARGKAQ